MQGLNDLAAAGWVQAGHMALSLWPVMVVPGGLALFAGLLSIMFARRGSS